MGLDYAYRKCSSIVTGGLGYLLSRDIDELKKLYEEIRSLEKTVESSWISRYGDMMRHVMGTCRYAALLTCLAIEEKGGEPPEPIPPRTKEIIRKLERARVVLSQPLDWMASVIMSGGRELVSIIDLAKFLKTECTTVSTTLPLTQLEFIDAYLFFRINEVCKEGFERLTKVVSEALKKNPLYLVRMFKDYEEAILSSINLRRAISNEFNTISSEFSNVSSQAELLVSNASMLSSEISRGLVSPLTIGSAALAYEEYRRRVEEFEKEREVLLSRIKELEERLSSYVSKLKEKEEELLRLREMLKEEELTRESIENELKNLREMISKYEEETKKYRELAEKLEHERNALAEKVSLLEKVLRGEEGLRHIPLSEARHYEVALRERFLDKFSRSLRIYDPIEDKWVEVRKWVIEKCDNLYTPASLGLSEEDLSRGIPLGLDIVCSYYKRVGLRKKKVVSVELVYYVRPKVYAEQGYDVKPMDLGEVINIVEPRSRSARLEGYQLVLIVSSPTGFTKKALEYISGAEFGRSIVSKNLILILYDPYLAKATFSVYDEKTKVYSELLVPITSAEKIGMIRKLVLDLRSKVKERELPPYTTYVELSEVCDYGRKELNMEITPEEVRAAFAQLQSEGLGDLVVVGGKYTIFGFKGG